MFLLISNISCCRIFILCFAFFVWKLVFETLECFIFSFAAEEINVISHPLALLYFHVDFLFRHFQFCVLSVLILGVIGVVLQISMHTFVSTGYNKNKIRTLLHHFERNCIL